jgi:type IV pilus assembly protein PilM
MSAFGLDLGTTSFKLVELEKTRTGFLLKHIGIAANPLGIVQVDSRDQRLLLAETIKKLFSQSKTKQNRVRINLAENQSFTRIISLPPMSDAELTSAISWEAEEHVPVPLSEVKLDWTVVVRPRKGIEGNMLVLLVAAKKTAINKLVDLVEEIGLELTGIETTLTSVARSLMRPVDPATIILHLGANTSDFCIYTGGEIRLVHSVGIGGATLTAAMVRDLGLAAPQAENYKRSYGLSGKFFEGKVRDLILPVFNTILDEAKKVINSFESESGKVKVNRVLMSGGTSLMPEAILAAVKRLGVTEVLMADPFGLCKPVGKVVIPAERSIYSSAVGLAMAGN